MKQIGIYSGRIVLRLNSRSVDAEVEQKFVENIQFKKFEPIVPTKPAVDEVKSEVSSTNKADPQTPSSTPKDVDSKPSEPKEQTTSFTNVDKKFAPEDILTKYLNIKKNKTEAPKEAVVCLNTNKQKKEKQEAKEKCNEERIKSKELNIDEKLLSDVVTLGEHQEIFYSFEDSLNQFVDQDLPDDFFEHTVSDLRYILHQVRRQM